MSTTTPETTASATADEPKVPAEAVRSIAAQEYFRPADLTVAGDAATPHGARFAGTMLDDGRQGLEWGARHEQILIGFLTGAEMVRNPYSKSDSAAPKKAGVPTGQPQLVYVQHVAGAEPPYAIVLDDGRQRRRVAEVIDERLRWIADTFVPAILTEKLAQQAIKLRNALLEWSKDHADAPQAKWLTRTFVNAILGKGADDGLGAGGWFTKAPEWKPVPCLLRIQVNGVDVDPQDPALMVQSVARKEAQIDTPPSLRARNIQRALDARGDNGEPKLNVKAVAQLMGMGDDALNNALLILKVIPDVAAAIDSGRLSQKVALIGQPGKRDAAFVTWPKGQPRTVIAEPAQHFVLKGLLDAFPGDEQIRGAKAFKVGVRLRAEALKGNLTEEAARAAAEGADAQGSDEPTVAEAVVLRGVAHMEKVRGQCRVLPSAEATVEGLVARGLLEWQPWQGDGAPESGRKPVLTEAGRAAVAALPVEQEGDEAETSAGKQPAKRSKAGKGGAIDRGLVLRLKEHAGRASASLPDPAENGLTTGAILDRQRDVASVGVLGALAAYLDGDTTALDPYPAAKSVFVAAQTEASAPPTLILSPEEVVAELCAAAIDEWEESNPEQFRKLEDLKVAEGAKVAGCDATLDEVTAANGKLAVLVAGYTAAKDAGSLDTVQASDPGVYLREKLYAA